MTFSILSICATASMKLERNFIIIKKFCVAEFEKRKKKSMLANLRRTADTESGRYNQRVAWSKIGRSLFSTCCVKMALSWRMVCHVVACNSCLHARQLRESSANSRLCTRVAWARVGRRSLQLTKRFIVIRAALTNVTCKLSIFAQRLK